ncbi:MAG: DUF402 domain-containing protein [Lachnospiraceae bacterium]|nr:DUF402 domain-containing protein [Lachnospiraceae bacterium]
MEKNTDSSFDNSFDLKLYRKRFIPAGCIPLKDDVIIEQTDDYILTTWRTINPKTTFDHGSSCYLLKDGVKISKFYKPDGDLLYWYCDIVEYEFNKTRDTLIVSDLLADVIIYPDGRTKVVDLDELADALDQQLITQEQATASLRQLNNLLSLLYRDKFDRFQAILNQKGL